ncbi:double-stranded RNA-specific editase Adar isoform X2 [Pieris brassicae]|uniref:double-stranded RNA-specific editase Adar isoform X2 n=1 Tax=Pieris brassicae TaxID=7116 RepID=UPI001E65F349|nr:double-stranded RNA-specific editase Adar isoform X2 [Pieris brassicae]
MCSSKGPIRNINGKPSPDMKRSTKRERYRYGDSSEGPPAKRIQVGFTINYQVLTRAAESVSSGAKSPVSALNELGIKVTYTVLDYRGPPHCPSFTVAVTAADMTFKGHGTSKRDARANAAKVCLNTLLANAGQIMPKNNDIDFSNDQVVHASVPKFQLPLKPSQVEETNVLQETSAPLPVRETRDVNEPAPLFTPVYSLPSHKSPVNIVYETFPGVVFSTTLGDGSPLDSETVPAQISHSMRFKTVCKIKEQVFEGYGSSKKQSKLAASRSALASLLGTPTEQISTPTTYCNTLPQYIADHVSKLINEKFTELMRNDPAHSKRKVLAGIVMTIGEGIEKSKIIAVSTGTKCVSGEYMSVSGRAVNDCHAEVAARRCLQRYLYNQLLMYASSKNPRMPIEESDLEPLPEGGYRLKENRQLHLYISTAPCGDGRIFSPHETQTERDKHPNRFSRGQLRSKIESGEGTIPVKKSAFIQTWDGVLQGERLLTMSCSDKVARWCVTGLQGALLSQLIKPIYLNSLVLGSLLHTEHMYRALCGRIEGFIQGLPAPYRLVAPKLARAASTETRSPARAPSFSVCWCAIAQAPEVVNAVTGKLDNELPSLLCKQAMFARWIYLTKQLQPLAQGNVVGRPLVQDPEKLLYAEAKQLSTSYQMAKQCLVTAFEKAQLGTWVKKPIEQDQFLCEIHEASPQVLFA